jgi:hypothetical protein
MKKIISIIIVLCLYSTGILFSEKYIWTNLSVNIFSHHDVKYKDIYGDFILAPEIKFNMSFFSDMYVWTSALYIPASWESEEYNITAKSKQLFLSVGLGDYMTFSEKLRGNFEIGIIYMTFSEQVDVDTEKGSDIGFRLNTGLTYRYSNYINFFTMISYIKGTSSVGIKEIKLGGLKLSAGVEIILLNKKEE